MILSEEWCLRNGVKKVMQSSLCCKKKKNLFNILNGSPPYEDIQWILYLPDCWHWSFSSYGSNSYGKKTVVLFYVENQNAEQNIENNRDKDCTTGELVPVILVKQAATRVFWFCLVYNILTLSI